MEMQSRRKIWSALQEIHWYESQSFIKQIAHNSDDITNIPPGTRLIIS